MTRPHRIRRRERRRRRHISRWNLIIDCHSHILPAIDDGARDLATSLEMLRLSGEQGVQRMIATPHFYASRDRLDAFLERRRAAFDAIRDARSGDMPEIRLGAEVAFFRGIREAEQIDALQIEGTNALLLEMPFRPWSQSDVDEVACLIEKRGFRIILAHLERYLPMRENGAYLRQLTEMPVVVQINAEGLLDWRQRGRLIRMFGRGEAHLLGSDCHGLRRRPPNLTEGRQVLRKKLGQDILDRIDRCGEQLC